MTKKISQLTGEEKINTILSTLGQYGVKPDAMPELDGKPVPLREFVEAWANKANAISQTMMDHAAEQDSIEHARNTGEDYSDPLINAMTKDMQGSRALAVECATVIETQFTLKRDDPAKLAMYAATRALLESGPLAPHWVGGLDEALGAEQASDAELSEDVYGFWYNGIAATYGYTGGYFVCSGDCINALSHAVNELLGQQEYMKLGSVLEERGVIREIEAVVEQAEQLAELRRKQALGILSKPGKKRGKRRG